jgi:hypothetical protein
VDPNLAEFGLSPGGLDDVIVTWRYAERRHAVLARDYTESSTYLSRLLERRAASSLKQSLASRLTALGEAGNAATVHVHGHELGLMRPLILGSRLDLGDAPFLIAFERGHISPEMPILMPSRTAAVQLVRELDKARWAETAGWRSYSCERLLDSLERLVVEMINGRVTSFATELERRMYFVDHPKPRRQRRAA